MRSMPVLHEEKSGESEVIEFDWFGTLAEDLLASSAQADFLHPDAGWTTPPTTAPTKYEPEPPPVRFGSPSSRSESSSTAMSDTTRTAPSFAVAPSQFSPDPKMLSSHLETPGLACRFLDGLCEAIFGLSSHRAATCY